jgi:sialate O-acetylesterase
MKRFSLILGLLIPLITLGEVTLNPLFSDHMVLQRDKPIRIYGRADTGEQVTVMFAGKKAVTVAEDGQWSVELPAMGASFEPQELTVFSAVSDREIKLVDVLMGDVWLCAGQSNMQFELGKVRRWSKEFHSQEKADYENPNIRLLRAKTVPSDHPLDEIECHENLGATWRLADWDAGEFFSATGFYFGKFLQPEIDVPLGLVMAAEGGTHCGVWMSKECLESPVGRNVYLDPYEKALEAWPAAYQKYTENLAKVEALKAKGDAKAKAPPMPMGPLNFRRPGALHNGMIQPLRNLQIKGVIWYQGEADHYWGWHYREAFPALIADWRKLFNEPELPFLFVQLPGYGKITEELNDSGWARVRDAQLNTWKNDKQTGMACIIELGKSNNQHPPFKRQVGERLAAMARGVVYGEDLVYSGPVFEEAAFKGNKARLRFSHTGGGLICKALIVDQDGPKDIEVSGDQLKGFSVCGEDQVFHRAEARIIDEQSVEIGCDTVDRPTQVRYAWNGFPLCNLFNKEGLPASPFRTDHFEYKK